MMEGRLRDSLGLDGDCAKIDRSRPMSSTSLFCRPLACYP